MSHSAIQQGVGAYHQWKDRVARAIMELDKWLQGDLGTTPETAALIQDARAVIQSDRLTLAVVAEHPVGAARLINSLHFPGHNHPLLPPDADFPPPFPIKIFWDGVRNEAYLHLLPFETLAQDKPLAEFAQYPRHWVQYPLNGQSPEQYTSLLQEIFRTKTTSQTEGVRLGLAGLAPSDPIPSGMGQTTLPKWRHARISLPHPLLKQGLEVLITPGLEGLDRDVEIANEVRDSAQVVLFVVSADTGVTPADLEIWQPHINGFRNNRQQDLVVVLDAVEAPQDRPWDAADNAPAGTDHRTLASATLGLMEDQVIAVSLLQGLEARMRGDSALLRRSGLAQLEQALSARLLEAKHRDLSDVLDKGVGQLVKRHLAGLSAQIARTQAHLQELEELQGKSERVIGQLIEQTGRQREHYLKAVARYQAARNQLIVETQPCGEILARHNIETLIKAAHREMAGSWTTHGLGHAMKGLFEALRQRMQAVVDENARLRKLVRAIYEGFHADLGFELVAPKVFIISRYQVELELLYQEVERFRRSPSMTFAEQASVIERFHEQMVSRARVLFEQLRLNLDPWIRDALRPIADAIHEHQAMMEQRLGNLRQVNRSGAGLAQRIEALRAELLELTKELTAIRNLHNALYQAPTTLQGPLTRPMLVAEQGLRY